MTGTATNLVVGRHDQVLGHIQSHYFPAFIPDDDVLNHLFGKSTRSISFERNLRRRRPNHWHMNTGYAPTTGTRQFIVDVRKTRPNSPNNEANDPFVYCNPAS